MYGGGLIGEHAVIANAGRPGGLVMEIYHLGPRLWSYDLLAPERHHP